jgi:3',5'-cyclic AMP phosphodiesterase CpdA
MNTLATLLHVSDLHFGDLDPETGDSALHPSLIDRWRRGREYYGWLGHTAAACRDAAILWKRLRDEESARLVVTGDLTAWGARGQFAAARRWLEEDLGCADAVVVPGNHDHWPGRGRVLGRSNRALRQFVPPTPFVRRFPLGPGLTLTLAGIDTDADVWAWSPARAWGRGAFRSQLRALAPMLGPCPASEIRVLALHHSPSREKYCLGIRDSSRRALAALCRECGVRMLMTGHTHGERIGKWEGLLEARCGTTLVRDRIPATWLAAGGGPVYDLPPNVALVHRLCEADDALIWTVTPAVRGEGGFAEGRPVSEAIRRPGFDFLAATSPR